MTDIITADDLVLERRSTPDKTGVVRSRDEHGEPLTVLLTPPVGHDYWAYRVLVADGQAVLGFGKFGTVGIGFAEESDWNTNLPYTEDAERIRQHIWHNRGDGIPDTIEGAALVVRAVELIQGAVREDRGEA